MLIDTQLFAAANSQVYHYVCHTDVVDVRALEIPHTFEALLP